MRISSEGRVLPPVHFVILGSLAMLLLLGFTLTSMQVLAIHCHWMFVALDWLLIGHVLLCKHKSRGHSCRA
jgi:Protein of unknown function (DUF4239)